MLHKLSTPVTAESPVEALKGSFAVSRTEEQKLEMKREEWRWECDMCHNTTTFEDSRNWFCVRVCPIQSMRWHDIGVFPAMTSGDIHFCSMGCAADWFMNVEQYFED